MRKKLDFSEEFVNTARKFAEVVTCWINLIRLLPEAPWGIDEMKRIRDLLMELCITAMKLKYADKLDVR